MNHRTIKAFNYYPWVKGMYVCSNKGTDPLQSGDNHKNVTMRFT
jgi:hypothetical protein